MATPSPRTSPSSCRHWRARSATRSFAAKGNKLTRPLLQRDGDRGVEPEG